MLQTPFSPKSAGSAVSSPRVVPARSSWPMRPDYGTYEEGEEQACRCDDRLAQRASVEDECHWNDENKGECRCVEHREQADAEGRFEDMLELIGAFEGGYHLRAAEYQQ